MKRELFLFCAVTVIIVAFSSCKNNRAWTKEHIDSINEYIVPLKDGGFVADMTEEEYGMFRECVVAKVMEKYPDYSKFKAIQSKSDTVFNVLVTCTADFLGVDYQNLRRLFPYKELVSVGILPQNLDKAFLDAFYTCAAEKIDATYESNHAFVLAMAGDYNAQSKINMIFVDCASQILDPTIAIGQMKVVAPTPTTMKK